MRFLVSKQVTKQKLRPHEFSIPARSHTLLRDGTDALCKAITDRVLQ
jgi:hypothetical protein